MSARSPLAMSSWKDDAMEHLRPILTNILVVCVLFVLAVLAFTKLPELATQDNTRLLIGFAVLLAIALIISIVRELKDDQAR
jgi:hypothetical protein